MIVENVRGAQPWVGRARANFGSFYLWGDVGMVGNRVVCVVEGKLLGNGVRAGGRAQKFNPDGTAHGTGSWFAVADSKNRGVKIAGVKIGDSPGNVCSDRPKGNIAGHREGTKVPGIKLSEVGFNVAAAQRYREGVKFSQSGDARFDGKPRDKMLGQNGPAAYGSKSDSRRAASAMIAKIPFALSQYVAQCFRP